VHFSDSARQDNLYDFSRAIGIITQPHNCEPVESREVVLEKMIKSSLVTVK
jgi:hypothetical protein